MKHKSRNQLPRKYRNVLFDLDSTDYERMTPAQRSAVDTARKIERRAQRSAKQHAQAVNSGATVLTDRV